MMRPMRLSELLEPLSGRLVGRDVQIGGVSTDSRSVGANDLFVALSGPTFDGHDFAAQVAEKGATALLTSRDVDSSLSQMRVDDTLVALGRLGGFNRSLFDGTVLAVTGSSGKTSVKNMLAAVFSGAGETLATEGNFNNEIGVPLTLLRLHPQVEYAVVEMGAAKAGDIAWLCELGRPRVAMLLNAMPAHLDGFGSVEDVANAKGEIFDRLGAGDVAVINADQPWARQWRKRAGAATVLDVGLEAPAAITARDIALHGFEGVSFTASTPAGDIAIRLGVPGRHNVANALVAIAAGLACDLPLTLIRDGLESLQSVAGRLRVHRTHSGAVIIDDCYNANPGSVRAAIEMLASCQGKRTLVLGAMLELGERSAAHHREIGAFAASVGLDRLVGVGDALVPAVDAFGTGGHWYADRESAAAALHGELAANDVVLIKGSRSVGMETVLNALVDQSSEKAAQSC